MSLTLGACNRLFQSKPGRFPPGLYSSREIGQADGVTQPFVHRMTVMSETRLSLKEMCATFDVTPRTLRYYEYIELLQPQREGRTRFYGPRERARMTLILRGRKWGFSLEDIRQWLLIYENEGTGAQMRSWVELADRQLDDLAKQHAQLAEAMTELREMRDNVARELDKKD